MKHFDLSLMAEGEDASITIPAGLVQYGTAFFEMDLEINACGVVDVIVTFDPMIGSVDELFYDRGLVLAIEYRLMEIWRSAEFKVKRGELGAQSEGRLVFCAERWTPDQQDWPVKLTANDKALLAKVQEAVQ